MSPLTKQNVSTYCNMHVSKLMVPYNRYSFALDKTRSPYLMLYACVTINSYAPIVNTHFCFLFICGVQVLQPRVFVQWVSIQSVFKGFNFLQKIRHSSKA